MRCQPLLAFFRHITIEPIYLLFGYGSILRSVILRTVLYEKCCLNYYPASVCYDMNNDTAVQDHVQRLTSQWYFYDNIAYTIPAIFSTLLTSSWSDHFSRKYPMLVGPVGLVVCSLAYIPSTIHLAGPLPYMLIPPAMLGMFGGSMVTSSACLSYLTERTDERHRTMRIAFAESMVVAAGTVGEFSSGPMLVALGAVYTLTLCIGAGLLTIVYIITFIKEVQPKSKNEAQNSKESEKREESHSNIKSIATNETDIKAKAAVHNSEAGGKQTCCRNISDKARQLFQVQYFYDGILTVTRHRPGNRRHRLIVLLTLLCLSTLLSSGARNLSYLFLRHHPLNWDPTIYGYYMGMTTAGWFIGAMIYVPILSRKLGVQDMTLFIIGIVSSISSNVLFGLSRYTWMVFLVPLMQFAEAGYIICTRSVLSSLVELDELGRVFGLLVLIENILSMPSGLVYEYLLYPATLDLYPGFVFLLAAGLKIIPLTMACWLHFGLKKEEEYTTLGEDLPPECDSASPSCANTTVMEFKTNPA